LRGFLFLNAMSLPYLEFLGFQSDQRGAVPVEDAAIMGSVSGPTVRAWIRRGNVKSISHRGKVFVGVDSLKTWLMVYRQVRLSEAARRREVAARHRKRVLNNQRK